MVRVRWIVMKECSRWQRSDCGEESYQPMKPGEDALLDAIQQNLRERETNKRFSLPSGEALPPLFQPAPDFNLPQRVDNWPWRGQEEE